MLQRTTANTLLPAARTTSNRTLRAGLWVTLLAGTLVCTLTGCGGGDEPPAQVQEPEYTLAELEAAKPVAVTPEQVAETFALGSKSTDLQRELLEKEVSGQVVEWDLQLYEVQLEDDIYTVSSNPIPIANDGGINLIRIVAEVRARTPEEHAFLRAVKTGDPIRLRGRVTAIALRTAVVLDPAVVVKPEEAAK
jgi:hypothetical protein